MATASTPRQRKRTQRRRGVRVAASVLRWGAVILLTLVYYTSCAMLLGAAAVFGFDELPPGASMDATWRYVWAAILVVLGVADFIFFPRIVRKLTGREVLSGPLGSGAGSGGSSDC